jgi:hypothetical protein
MTKRIMDNHDLHSCHRPTGLLLILSPLAAQRILENALSMRYKHFESLPRLQTRLMSQWYEIVEISSEQSTNCDQTNEKSGIPSNRENEDQKHKDCRCSGT